MTATERRAAIIEAAIKLFSERGFRGATTRELAAAVGVSEPVLYQHFPSKRDLYTAIIETVMSREQYSEVERLLSDETAGPRVILRKLAEAAIQWHRQNEDYLRLVFFSALERHELADLANQAHAGRFFRLITNYVQREMDRGRLKKRDANLVARVYLGLVGDACKQRMLHGCDPLLNTEIDALLPQMVDVLLDGIETTKSI